MSGMCTLHVDIFSTRFVRDVDARHARADQLVLADRLLRRRAREFQVERLIADELTIGDRATRVAIDGHHALRYREAAGLHAEPGRGPREQCLARFRGRRAHLRAAAVDG
jgi:hypothetical protein